MNTNGLNPAVGLAMGLGGGIMHAQPNANASSSQFQANAAASQMVPLMLQMQPGGGISLVPFQAQTQAQGFGQQSSPQWLGMPSPQTPAMSQSQAQFVQSSSAPGFVPPGQAVATVNDLMALAAAMQQVSQEVPVGSVADDEEVLVKALRTGIARGLSYEQALRGLHNTNRHTETAWKNYFLAHLDRLYPKVLARKEGHPKPESHSGPKPQPLYLTKNEHQPGRSAPSKTIKQEKPPKGAYYGHNHSPSRPHSGPRSERTSDRHKPASSHAQHPPSASMRNTLPHVTRVTSQSLRVGIKKPRIRLKKRVVRSPTPTPEPSAASSSSETESEDRAYASSDGSDPESEYERAAGTKGKGPLNQRVCNKITEDDFRAMARYIYENPRDEPPKGVSFWREFAQRKENAERRSLDAWARAALSHEDSEY
ncbi:hypothetical protein L226DRAFT_131714 [Lentinus tigrinus ALCF2SS1-7]|uniref:uncharacterized protein n=1 Tax=Lentinus tigrinus ALCF2SS1-7 TaxID=1328758 RepID=UPI001166072A|nr:hypothetical protein L226DRAFT_131714 [Lentinus tigrinus ALCF2SS1-7]